MDARFKIPVAAEDAGGDEIVIFDRLFDFRFERAAIADAGCAAIGDELKSELVEVFLQIGFLQIIGDDARAGSEACLNHRIDGEPFFDRFFREETCADHDEWVAGVGAARDGGDDDEPWSVSLRKDCFCIARRDDRF